MTTSNHRYHITSVLAPLHDGQALQDMPLPALLVLVSTAAGPWALTTKRVSSAQPAQAHVTTALNLKNGHAYRARHSHSALGACKSVETAAVDSVVFVPAEGPALTPKAAKTHFQSLPVVG